MESSQKLRLRWYRRKAWKGGHVANQRSEPIRQLFRGAMGAGLLWRHGCGIALAPWVRDCFGAMGGGLLWRHGCGIALAPWVRGCFGWYTQSFSFTSNGKAVGDGRSPSRVPPRVYLRHTSGPQIRAVTVIPSQWHASQSLQETSSIAVTASERGSKAFARDEGRDSGYGAPYTLTKYAAHGQE